MTLTDKLVSPDSPMWRRLVDEFTYGADDQPVIEQERSAHRQVVVVETRYGKTTKVIKFRTIYTTNPTFGPYRATTNA